MKLLLIDGYSLLFRAYFSSPPFTTKAGQPTGALFGFAKMVLKLLDDKKPDYVLVALDAHAPTFRHDADATYKANRPETPDDMKAQTAIVRDMLRGLGIPYYEHVGFEADDIIGTLSAMGKARDCAVTIVTGDGDSLQLVNDAVSVMLTRKGVTDLAEYSPDGVHERFGFGPELVPDYKGLRGDSSDNIPGVPGIGEKTATVLLTKFGGLEAIYERVEEVTPPRIRDLLITHREIAFHSRHMARIIMDLPVEIDFEACRYTDARRDEEMRSQALATAKELEFRSLIARYAAALNADVPDDAEPQTAAAISCETTQTDDAAAALAWLEMRAENSIAVQVADAALTFADEQSALIYSGKIEGLSAWLANENRAKSAHDAKALLTFLLERDVPLRGVKNDTLLMAYLLDPAHQAHPVAALCEKFLHQTLATASAAAAPKSLFDDGTDSPEQLQKQADEVCAIARLAPVLREELEKVGESALLDELELPLIPLLAGMERCGMLLDVEKLQETGVQFRAEAARLQGEIWQLAGGEFNISSTKQLQTILFEKLGLAKGRAIKSGHSTDAATLEKLAEEHDVVRKILEYRSVTKLLSTYVDNLLASRNVATGRIHTTLNQTGTVSGRVSSNNPNLQNIPIRTAQGRLIRRAFVAPPGCVLLKADYSQIELRILAHITGDEPLVEAFRRGEDVHVRTASELFNVAVGEVDSDMRRKAKMVNYAIAYGVSGFGLSKQLGMDSPKEAQAFINHYFATLPGIKKYIDDTTAQAKAQGYVATLRGRRRPLPEINSPRAQDKGAAERTAINHPIQGTAADVMKIAMLAVAAELQQRACRTRMIMQVHDELVFEMPEDEVADLAPVIGRLMSEAPTARLGLKVPLETDLSVGGNWEETKKI